MVIPASTLDPSPLRKNPEAAPPAPKILAIETSGRAGSISLGLGPDILCTHSLVQSMRHAAALMPAIHDLVKSLGWKPQELQHIYVSTGPGSFTGLRIAITVTRALHLALGNETDPQEGIKIVAVPTLDVLAGNVSAQVQNLVVVLDAKRGQIFSARYRRLAPGEAAPVGALLIPTSLTDLSPSIPAPQPLICTAGPALVDPTTFIRETPRPLAILGEGIDYHRPALQAGVETPSDLIELDRTLWPGSAATVYRLGYAMAQRHQFTAPEELLPVYIRLPEAEEVWRKRHGLPIPTPSPLPLPTQPVARPDR